MAEEYWEVIGGGTSGGLLVRTGKETSSPEAPQRLSKGALLSKVELIGERLHYSLLEGEGPSLGWVSIKLKGKDIVARTDRMPKEPREQFWEVVGGAASGGVLVRTGKDKESPEASARLSVGAFVRQLQLDGERLNYELLSGAGPGTGWVSLKVKGKDLLVRKSLVSSFLRLVGNPEDPAHAKSMGMVKAFIADPTEAIAGLKTLFKQADPADTKTKRKCIRFLAELGDVDGPLEALEDPDFTIRCEALLALGELGDASAKAVDILAEILRSDKEWRVRCWAARALGMLRQVAAPASAKLQEAVADDDLDVQAAAVQALRGLGVTVDSDSWMEAFGGQKGAHPPITDRKIRILALHGVPSNSSLLKVQTAALKGALGKDAEWIYVDSPMQAEFIPGATDVLLAEPDASVKMMAGGKPFLRWFSHGNQVSARVEEGVANLRKALAENDPVDVIVSYSQGSCIVALLLDELRRESAKAPWKLNVFFSGGDIVDPIYQFPPGWKSDVPTVRSFSKLIPEPSNINGEGMYPQLRTFTHPPGGDCTVQVMYSDLVELGHTDGHNVPRTAPRAQEIFKEIASRIKALL